MKIILSHAGKQHSYYVARALYQLGLLEQFYTSSYLNNKFLQSLVLRYQNTFWSRRFIEGLPVDLVTSNWRFEIKEILYSRLYGKGHKTLDAVYKRDKIFDRYMTKELSKRTANVFWGFQGSCLDSLKQARSAGMTTICELSTGHVVEATRLLGEEARLHPEWADSFDNLTFPEWYEDRLKQEPHEADYVIAASKFTQKTLEDSGVNPAKIINMPLGFDLEQIPFDQDTFTPFVNRPLKLLYVGRITQRKGIKYLLEAMKSFDRSDVELHVIGFIHGSGEALRHYSGVYKQHAAVSQQELFRKYSEYDALVLPSLFEGFGLVIVEALAAGLPVITTSNTIGADLIRNDENGYLLPIRDIAAISKSISSLLSKDQDKLMQMRVMSRESALSMSWHNYTKRLKPILQGIGIEKGQQ